MDAKASFIGVDWGTSSFRAFLLTADGRPVDQIAEDAGIKRVSNGAFSDVLDRVVARWPNLPEGAPLIMCGMIGSAQGWHEVPYITAPEQADVSGLSQGCFRFSHQDRHISIIPGLSLAGFDGTIDVMRGEETLYLGATAGLPEQDRYICLPGTHSKWIDARAGRIDSFATFMTGEMFELATSHSMLAPVLEVPAELDMNSFRAGLAGAEKQMGLLNQLFSVRAEIVTGRRNGLSGYSFVSGLIIGAELSAVAPRIRQSGTPVIIIASGKTAQLYQIGCAHFGIPTSLCDATDAVIAGLAAIYRFQHCD